MNLKERLRLFEEHAKILESLANQHGQDSREYEAVRHAAIALWFVLVESPETFLDFVDRWDSDLSPEQRARLAEMGIDPDKEPK